MPSSDRGAEQLVRIDGRRLRLSNLEKILYPATGTTKGEVIDYYTRIADVLIPHVAGRPVTRKRWPDGVGTDEHPQQWFFAKDLEAGAPAWIRSVPIPHSTGAKSYPQVGDVPTLVYLAQVASLELHVPQWRFTADGERGAPDRLVLDLDPGPGTGLAECAIVARWAQEILTGMGLDPLPVTSGSKGIHLYAGLPRTQTSEQISLLAKELARSLEADHPDLVVSQMAKAARPGRVFIDWSQNNAAKTTIAPYSLRGRAEPTVAAPRTWDEIDDPALRHLRFDEVLERVTRGGDPLAPLGFHAGGRADSHGPLASYLAKRTSGRTPEPLPSNALGHVRSAADHTDGRPRFVIQEHHASRLHWDLRLERDGVLVSWAVPRGIPPTSTRNALAVMTEDHPLEYLTFAGAIPKGEYGAGEMTVWDTGRYDIEKWRDDEIIFTAEGQPGGPLGRVRLALIRTDGNGEKSTWLLHRMKTDATGVPQARARTVADPGPAPDGDPHATAKTDPGSAPASSPEPADARADTRPMLATTATAGVARAMAARWAGEADEAWAEIKWDGIRAVGIWDGARLRLRTRRGNDVTGVYPDLTSIGLALDPTPAVLDGEIIALDETGRPSFSRLQSRMNLSRPAEISREALRTPVRYHVFDLLALDGRSTAHLPLTQRRALLEQLLAHVTAPLEASPVFTSVADALELSGRFELEGIMVKNPSSTYQHGARSPDWLKVKHTRTQEVVIGAIRPGKGHPIGSLLVGIPDGDVIRYAGRVGSGFSDAALGHLRELLAPRRTDQNPFTGVPDADASDAQWVLPELVGEVEYAELTPGGMLRHARWRGLRPDKSASDVQRER